jgi:hypothetical protein
VCASEQTVTIGRVYAAFINLLTIESGSRVIAAELLSMMWSEQLFIRKMP